MSENSLPSVPARPSRTGAQSQYSSSIPLVPARPRKQISSIDELSAHSQTTQDSSQPLEQGKTHGSPEEDENSTIDNASNHSFEGEKLPVDATETCFTSPEKEVIVEDEEHNNCESSNILSKPQSGNNDREGPNDESEADHAPILSPKADDSVYNDTPNMEHNHVYASAMDMNSSSSNLPGPQQVSTSPDNAPVVPHRPKKAEKSHRAEDEITFSGNVIQKLNSESSSGLEPASSKNEISEKGETKGPELSTSEPLKPSKDDLEIDSQKPSNESIDVAGKNQKDSGVQVSSGKLEDGQSPPEDLSGIVIAKATHDSIGRDHALSRETEQQSVTNQSQSLDPQLSPLAQPVVPERPTRTTTPKIPSRPRKTNSAASLDQVENTESVASKQDDVNLSKKAPPPKPKKLSSKIAAFQQMFNQAPLEQTVPKAGPVERSKLSSDQTNFASNLQTMMGQGLPLPGMANPELMKKLSLSDQTKESDSEDSSNTLSNASSARRARGPRGKRLPKQIQETKIEVEPRFKVSVADLWEVKFSKSVPKAIDSTSDVTMSQDSNLNQFTKSALSDLERQIYDAKRSLGSSSQSEEDEPDSSEASGIQQNTHTSHHSASGHVAGAGTLRDIHSDSEFEDAPQPVSLVEEDNKHRHQANFSKDRECEGATSVHSPTLHEVKPEKSPESVSQVKILDELEAMPSRMSSEEIIKVENPPREQVDAMRLPASDGPIEEELAS